MWALPCAPGIEGGMIVACVVLASAVGAGFMWWGTVDDREDFVVAAILLFAWALGLVVGSVLG